MVSTSEAILSLFPLSTPRKDWVVFNGEINYWNPALGIQPTEQELAAVTKEQVDAAKATRYRNAAKAILDAQEEQAALVRALALATMDAVNTLRTWTRNLKTEIAASTSLADFKTRVATLSTLNDGTLAQLKNAIKSHIDSGTVD